MRKQFDYMHLINYKNDTLSLGGGGLAQIRNTSIQYAEAGAKNGAVLGGTYGFVFGVYEIVTVPQLYWVAGLGRGTVLAEVPSYLASMARDGAIVGAVVGTVVGGTVGAAVGTVDALRHSGSGRSRTSSPARRF